MIRALLTYSFVLVLTLVSFGQADVSFSLTVKKNAVNIGDPIYATLQLSSANGSELSEVVYPYFSEGESINDTIDVWEVKQPIVSNSTWSQEVVFSAFWGGDTELGPFAVVINGDTLKSNTVTLQVYTPEVDLESQFKGIKPIFKDPFTNWELVKLWFKKYWVVAIAILSILVLVLILKLYLTKRKNRVHVGPIIPLPIQLMAQLIAVEEQQLWQKNQHKEYYTGVTDVIRKLIEYKFDIPAMEKTSHEILSGLKLSSIDKSELNQLSRLFELADVIKFAKSTPQPEENKKAMLIAKNLLTREIEAKK
jgi:hypothetical protein